MSRKRKAKPHRSNSKRNQTCGICNVSFDSLMTLFNHAKQSDNEECLATLPHCKPCDRPFQTFDGLHRHFRTCPNNGREVHNLHDTHNQIDQTEFFDTDFTSRHDNSSNRNIMYASAPDNSLYVEQHVPIHHHNQFNINILPPSPGIQISNEVYNSNTVFVFDPESICSKIRHDEIATITEDSPSVTKAKFFLNFFSNHTSTYNFAVNPMTMKQCSIAMHDIISELVEECNFSCLFNFENVFSDLEQIDDSSLYHFLWRYCNSSRESLDDHIDLSDDDDDIIIHSNPDSLADDTQNDIRIFNKRMSSYQEKIEDNQKKCHESLTNTEVALLELHRLLQKAGAPMYLFDEITKWSQKHHGAFGSLAGTPIPSKRKFTKDVANKIYTEDVAKSLRPIRQTIQLSPRNKVTVTKFSFEAQLINLLTNTELMQEENLLLNLENPFDSVPHENCRLDDLNSGWWYRETHMEICKETNEILLPLVFFIDGGKVTERLSIEPIVFTLGIFNRKTRNRPDAWRTLGYIESIKNYTDSSFCKNEKIPTRDKWEAYHKIIENIIQPMVILLGKDGGFQWTLTLLGVTYKVIFKLAIQAILGDSEGLSKLCLHYGKTNSKVLCRDCMVSFTDSDDPQHRCVFTTKFDILGKSRNELKQICKHDCKNAFDPCYFGARNSSIYDCTPPEPLHAILLGLFVYQYQQFMVVASRAMEDIEYAVQYLYQNFSRQSDRSLPSLQSIQNSVRNPGTLSATHQYDRAFATYLALLSPDIFKKLCDEIDGGYTTAKKWFYLFQRSLSMYQWVMKQSHSKNQLSDSANVESEGQQEIRSYLTQYHELVSKRGGSGCRVSKFHHSLHYVRNIGKTGSSRNIDTGRPESNAVYMYKNFASMTQRRQESIVSQIATRHFEDLVMSDAIRILIDTDKIQEPEEEQIPRNVLTGSKYTISVSYHEDIDIQGNFLQKPTVSFEWEGDSYYEERFPSSTCFSIGKRLYQTFGSGGSLSDTCTPIGRTEYIDNNGLRYRANPSFEGEEWFDWCLIKWNDNDLPYPAKIITFLDLSQCDVEYISNSGVIDGRETYLDQRIWVVIQSGQDVPVRIEDETLRQRIQYSLDPIIGKRYRLEERFRIIDVQQIVGPCYCVPEDYNGDNWNYSEFVCINSIDTWYKGFLDDE